ncbi:hypothetical protein AXF42_Ash008700 [Apostasia shenzhenica]|uniref:Uncharacterized protein n=1 Tax=Apostasia shenzhenica TaxID=1088818 RepID=A0A2I0B250_9ASPA|nr:hypothetical protein AXF42_Ash008700 [Apostasia shenzhenica]
MSKLCLLSRSVLKHRVALVDPLRRVPLRSFSSGEEQQESPADGIRQEEPGGHVADFSQGPVYGRLLGFGKNTLKTDIIHLFEGCNLSTSDVKFEYNNGFAPISLMLQFPSESFYEAATKLIIKKGRLYNLHKISSGQWDITESHDGKTVLLLGFQRSPTREELERFLSGFDYDGSSLRILSGRGPPGTVDSARTMVTFRASSALKASAFQIQKNRSLCINSPIFVRVLQ